MLIDVDSLVNYCGDDNELTDVYHNIKLLDEIGDKQPLLGSSGEYVIILLKNDFTLISSAV